MCAQPAHALPHVRHIYSASPLHAPCVRRATLYCRYLGLLPGFIMRDVGFTVLVRVQSPPAHRGNDTLAQLWVWQQKCSVVALFRYSLRAAQVQVYRVHESFDVSRSLHLSIRSRDNERRLNSMQGPKRSLSPLITLFSFRRHLSFHSKRRPTSSTRRQTSGYEEKRHPLMFHSCQNNNSNI